MPAAFSMDLRVRMMALLQQGHSAIDIADRLGVCDRTVRRLRDHLAATGSLEPKDGRPGPKPRIGPDRYSEIVELVARHDDVDSNRLAELIFEELGVIVSARTARRLRRAAGLTRKKRRPWPPNNSERMLPPPESPGTKAESN